MPKGQNYDISIKDSKGKEYTFMLMRDAQRTKQFQVKDLPYLPPALITGVSSLSNLHPEDRILIKKDDWRHGFDEDYSPDSNDSDQRFKNRIMGAPKKQSAIAFSSLITSPVEIPITDGGMEIWTDDHTLTYWSKAGTGALNKSTTKHGGTYAAELDVSTAETLELYRDISTFASYRSKLIILKAWVRKEAGIDTFRFGIGDQTSTTWVDCTKIADDTFTQLQVFHTLAADATRLRLSFYAEEAGATKRGYVDDVTISYLSLPLTDGGLEAWTGNELDNWTKDGADMVMTDETSEKITGSHSAKITGDDGTENHAQWYSANIAWNAKYLGKTISVSMCAKTGNTCKVGLKRDSEDIDWSSDYTTNSWGIITGTKFISSAFTNYKVYFYARGTDAQSTYIDNIAPLYYYGPIAGEVKAFVEFGGYLLFASGNTLYKISSGAITTVSGFPETITDLCVFKSRLYIAQSYTYKYWYTSDLATFTISTVANAEFMASVNGKLEINTSNYEVKRSTNPVNGGAAFSSATTVGTNDYNITGLVDDASVTYIRKQDQVYYLTTISDTVVALPLLPKLAAETNTSVDYPLYRWGDYLCIPSGVASFHLYDVSSETSTTKSVPGYAIGDENLDSHILALAGDAEWLYVIVDNGTGVVVLAARYETINSNTRWVWHKLYSFTSNDITAMIVSGLDVNQRLYMATGTVADGIYEFTCPATYSDVLLEASYEVQSSFDHITPWQRASTDYGTDLYFSKIIVTSYNFAAKTTIRVDYKIRGDSDWTQLGFCSDDTYSYTASPRAITYPLRHTDQFAISRVGSEIQFRFHGTTSLDELSPIIVEYKTEASLAMSTGGGEVSLQERQIVMVVKAGHEMLSSGGIVSQRTPGQQIADLRALKAETLPLTLRGLDGLEYKVKFKSEGLEEIPVRDEINKQAEFALTCTLKEV